MPLVPSGPASGAAPYVSGGTVDLLDDRPRQIGPPTMRLRIVLLGPGPAWTGGGADLVPGQGYQLHPGTPEVIAEAGAVWIVARAGHPARVCFQNEAG